MAPSFANFNWGMYLDRLKRRQGREPENTRKVAFGSEADSLQQFDRVAAIEVFQVSQARFSGNIQGNRQLLHRAAAHGASWKATALGQKRPPGRNSRNVCFQAILMALEK